MKRGLIVLMVAALLWSCHTRMEGPQRIQENGVEVVVNGPAPYAVSGQPRSLSLHEEFRIDLEDASLAEAGLADASTFSVDSKGRIYLFRPVYPGTKGQVIYRFDDHGKFLKSFGTIGQGPGELMYPNFLRMTAADEIPVLIGDTRSLAYLDSDGRLLRSSPLPSGYRFIFSRFVLLPNGNLLGQILPENERNQFSKLTLTVFDARLKKIRDVLDFKLSEDGARKELLSGIPLIAVTGSGFFVNSGPSGSDIAAYDLDGQLIRRIRAPFPAVRVPEEAKKALLDRIPDKRGYEPIHAFVKELEKYPRFQALFADDSGRLFVAGTEKDPESGANICDVFSPEGVRLFRTALGYHNLLLSAFLNEPAFDVVIKQERCYCLREKADGFKEVVVYSMIWR